MNSIKSIGVFCGSSPGTIPEYVAAARSLGSLLAQQAIRLVYGGGNMGVMGELARAAMHGGGRAIGVIPERLNAMVAHTDLTELRVVPGMHERKQTMYDLADAFIIMPGGIGTMEEFFEIFTWQCLGYHQKPIGILNVHGFFKPLFQLLDHMRAAGFVKGDHIQALNCSEDPQALIQALRESQYRYVPKLPERQ